MGVFLKGKMSIFAKIKYIIVKLLLFLEEYYLKEFFHVKFICFVVFPDYLC